MNEDFPLVSVISVNYNQSAVTLEMLESFRKVTYPNYEIIIVDNGSPNDNPEIIRNNYPEVNLIKSAENLGFAGGNNLGIKIARGDYLLFLNNDTEVTPGFLEPLVETLENNPDAGMASPLILYHHSPDKRTIQYAGAKKVSLLTGRGRNIGWGEIDTNQYNFTVKTDYAHGAALLLDRKVLDKVGCMPDVYFLYYEELDWCTAMKRKGLYPYFVGKSVIYHKESMSIGKNSAIKLYYITRNRLVYLRRNAPLPKRTVAMMFFLFISLPALIFRLIAKKETRYLKWVWEAIVWNLKGHENIAGFPKLSRDAAGDASLIDTNDLTFHKDLIDKLKKEQK